MNKKSAPPQAASFERLDGIYEALDELQLQLFELEVSYDYLSTYIRERFGLYSEGQKMFPQDLIPIDSVLVKYSEMKQKNLKCLKTQFPMQYP